MIYEQACSPVAAAGFCLRALPEEARGIERRALLAQQAVEVRVGQRPIDAGWRKTEPGHRPDGEFPVAEVGRYADR